MLRLAGFQSDVVREIITEQMIWGFQVAFGIDISGKPKEEKVKAFLYRAEHIDTDDGISERNLKGIARRLENMYRNLADKEHEYTFDEFGEFLMDECLLYFGTLFSREEWKRFGTPEKYQEINAVCQAYAEDSTPEDCFEYDVEKEAKDLYESICYLPDLAYSRGHETVLYWDKDFTLYYGWNAMARVVHMHEYTVCTLDGEYVDE